MPRMPAAGMPRGRPARQTTMSTDKPAGPETNAAPQQAVTALSDDDLDQVTGGGGGAVAEIVVTKKVDAASTRLFNMCCTGKHL